ncbi:PREDICTED: transcription termination factor 2-like [Dufourea novaeangliae]|uniref:Transcription termination factor 2 n=1 Tax=Dufourea novaeangliae TaxID=178035 RepID=A0A154PR97_DUFNO|nr:PREDICTED: transcription termination factor 2-like [Dufourea novaeangliae]KZC14429.1 Transcription termination factor 2 [Dufourea novaeangliae]
MDDSFSRWRDSPSRVERMSFVISDSDEDIVNNATKEQIFVVESSGSSTNVSGRSTPQTLVSSNKSSSATRNVNKRDRKNFMHHDSDSETDKIDLTYSSDEMEEDDTIDDKETKLQHKFKNVKKKTSSVFQSDISGSSYENGSNDDNTMQENFSDSSMHLPKKRTERQHTVSTIITVDDEDSLEAEVAVSLAKKEIGVGNIDPLVAQKRALLVCKMEQLQGQLSKTKLLLTTGNIDLLPDKGKKLRESIVMQEREIEEVANELENTPLVQNDQRRSHSFTQDVSFVKEEFKPQKDTQWEEFDSHHDVDYIPMEPTSSLEVKELGKKAQATLSKELALTVDRLQDLHGSLVARPSEDERAEDPRGLKVKLMPHQQHALAWLIWREEQRPPGGVLADDMGLGKTLTMISLIIASIAKKKHGDTNEGSDDEWSDHKSPLRHKGGTLVVCPASLLSQWENEITNRCKRGMLSVEVYHGSNRESVPKRLAKNDVVITTYNILSREFKTRSTVYRIHWERVILDEAHIVRNHKSQASEAVCGLLSSKRWALTGTPIQNKELDLYSILKFLKCSPFDDIRVWKRWVDNKNAAGRQRLATVMKTLMLRRTKQELQAKGCLESLPEKFIEEVTVKLDAQEKLVYEKVLIYSRTLFAQFLAQGAEKHHMFDLAGGKYDTPTFLSNPNKNTQFTKAQNKLLSMHADVKTHEILVLLLRLRQICVHPSLIHSMLDQEDIEATGLTETENMDPNLLSQMTNIKLYDLEGNKGVEQEIGVDSRVATNVLTSKNTVFQADRISSKIKMMLRKVEEILLKDDKLIIVSQWTSMLNIVASFLPTIKGATFKMFTGNVAIKDRQGVMDAFNSRHTDPRILLLSLTAGGVGLNLVGGNHLLLLDIHWNPQLEVQAQDRIYRFGQKKNVFIYKFICEDTIEERIKHLQEKKMEIAQNVLSGDKNTAVSKLTLNDLKSLFAL